ncbi:MAG TPA: YARHG domain-containing protein [Allosphingosinicella sp.]|jgi:hypothetical protein|nr:YARHG domain-containing protein [Allosphingosinicella sp.]
MVDVFISYSRTDQAAVARLAEAVSRVGLSVWWDAELPPHRAYGDVITEQITSAKAAIVVWSKEAAASEWVRAEADVARGQKKLIQVSLDDVMPPMPFNQIQFASLRGWNGETDHPGWRKIMLSLDDLCGGERLPEPRPLPGSRPAPAQATKSSQAGLGIALGAVAVVAALALGLWLGRANLGHHYRPIHALAPAPIQAATAEPPQAGTAAPAQVATTAPPEQPKARPSAPAPAPAAPAAAPPITSARPAPLPSSFGRWVIPDSGTRRLTAADLAGLTPQQLKIARNEIFARHGRIFLGPALQAYFSAQPWYSPRSVQVALSPLEAANVALIRDTEARSGSVPGNDERP